MIHPGGCAGFRFVAPMATPVGRAGARAAVAGAPAIQDGEPLVPEGGDPMRHPLKGRLALANLMAARFEADHGRNDLQAVFDPVAFRSDPVVLLPRGVPIDGPPRVNCASSPRR
jgi:hypothetical protein